MTIPPQQPMQQTEVLAAINLLTLINKFNLKIFSAKSRQALIFLILNDTAQLVKYDRAALWTLDRESPKLEGVSGQAKITTTSDLAKKWQSLIRDLKDPGKVQLISQDSFSKEKRIWLEIADASTKPTILWLPIFSNEKLHLGLWLERWNGVNWTNHEAEVLNFIVQAFGIAWEKYIPKLSYKLLKNKRAILTGIGIILIILSMRVSSRIVAPCEIVPKNPIVITAPLEDIIAQVDVKPGQHVSKDEILFEYDKRAPMENLKAAQETVKVAQLDLNRAKTLALKDEKSLAEISVLAAKLKKEQVSLSLAEFRASQLTVRSPEAGIVILDDPEGWRGKPVHVGEKIMIVTDPDETKIRIWIPESDNIVLDSTKPIRIILNIDPEISRKASLIYIANASTINEKHVASFVAEADWIDNPKGVKMGVKGTAILYGPNTSIFYLIMRKPWDYFRNFIGL